MTKPILIIHPKDKTTRFLDKIKNHLLHEFDGKIHHFNIQFTDLSHIQCLDRIQEHPDNGLIIFLGHGRSNALSGSCSPNYDSLMVSLDAEIENPEILYGKEIFIDEQNVDVFRNKNVFCLACNSNDKIAKQAIEKGANCFFGFGDIPTSNAEFVALGELDKKISLSRITKEMKSEINYIIKRSLEIGIKKSLTFKELKEIMRFIVNQRIADVLVNKKDLKERRIIADYLYFFKRDMKLWGDGSVRLS